MDLSASLQQLKNQPFEQHLEWANRRLPPWVAALLVIAIAWKLADITWVLLGGFAKEPAAVPAVQTQGSAVAVQTANNFNSEMVASANLFGTFNANEVQAPVEVEDAPETNLPLTLFGTAASDDDGQAFALIEHNGGSKAYFVGDSLPGGASLHSVYADHAMIRRGPALEKLPRKTLADSKGQTGSRRVASRSRSRPARPQENLGNLREELMANPAKFTDIVRPTPIYNNGKLAGYRVYPGRERQKFIEIGLKPGDLVTAINSTTLDDPAQGAKIFRELATASSVNLTVERAGQSMNIPVNLGGS
ncbi:MAG: type II secretion system protein GspC [Pseudomonadota bacterium]